ncbi:hypothetical protein LVY72_23215 [Arthrobacter sp. I2-34]|uniref:DUF1918 domain-containing protein n=1 Tax=Arthrobacter hankyongi TaxID=2904801 RepID=A0ABS9LDP3_9MICC|nr:hypothetical protein [Arthrobacter hankyongi]MCG2624803.1 hypothetical protein [Arthrobacter hankyongi]
MTKHDHPVSRDAAVLRAGDKVTFINRGGHRRHGTVDEAAHWLNIIWIRDARTGERNLFSTDENEIHPR